MESKEFNQMSEISPLTKMVFLGNFTGKLKYLASLAEPENWKYDYEPEGGYSDPGMKSVNMLYQYIHHTFAKALDEEKLLEMGDHLIMNTGLLTPNAEEIFMLMKRNDQDLYPSDKIWFMQSFYQRSDHAIPREMESVLPAHIDYFENSPEELYFNPRWDINVNIDHIVKEGFCRLPKSLQSISLPTLITIITGLIETMKKRILRNHRLIVPQYYNK